MLKKIFLLIVGFGSVPLANSMDSITTNVDWFNNFVDATGVYKGNPTKEEAFNKFKKEEQEFLAAGTGKGSSAVPSAGTSLPNVVPTEKETSSTEPSASGAEAFVPESSQVKPKESNTPKKLMIGYYQNWTRYSPGPQRPVFTPKDLQPMIDAGLNVVNYAFVRPYPNAFNIQDKNLTAEEAEADVAKNLDSLRPEDFNKEETFRSMMTDPWADVDINRPWNGAKDSVYGSFQELEDLKKKNPHIKIMPSFGGWTLSNGFPSATKTAERREKLAQLMVNFAKRYGFDGIDVDWEYPGFRDHLGTPGDKDNFVLFLTELSKRAKKEGLLLTLAVAADSSKIEAGMKLKDIHPLVDWLSIMAYDFNGPWGQQYTGHNAPLYHSTQTPGGANPPSADGTFNAAYAVEMYLKAGVPAKKIVLGMPLYGRSFEDVADNNNGLFSRSIHGTGLNNPGPGTVEKGVVSLLDIEKNYLTNKEWTNKRDQESGNVPYLYNKSGKFITYDDTDSLRSKGSFVKLKELGGAMVWPVEQGDVYTKSINAIANSM